MKYYHPYVYFPGQTYDYRSHVLEITLIYVAVSSAGRQQDWCSNEVIRAWLNSISSPLTQRETAAPWEGLKYARSSQRKPLVLLQRNYSLHVAKVAESDVFGWGRIPNNNGSRSRIFCLTPDVQLDDILYHTPKLWSPDEMVQFLLKLLL